MSDHGTSSTPKSTALPVVIPSAVVPTFFAYARDELSAAVDQFQEIALGVIGELPSDEADDHDATVLGRMRRVHRLHALVRQLRDAPGGDLVLIGSGDLLVDIALSMLHAAGDTLDGERDGDIDAIDTQIAKAQAARGIIAAVHLAQGARFAPTDGTCGDAIPEGVELCERCGGPGPLNIALDLDYCVACELHDVERDDCVAQMALAVIEGFIRDGQVAPVDVVEAAARMRNSVTPLVGLHDQHQKILRARRDVRAAAVARAAA